MPFIFPDHVHQTDRLRGLSVCIWESRKGGQRGGGWQLSFIFYLLPSLSISDLSRALSLLFSFPCAAHLYPPALRGGRLLGFGFFFFSFLLSSFPTSSSTLFLASLFIYRPSSIHLQSSSSPAATTTSSSSYLSAKISWSNVETDEGNEQNDLVLAAHKGPWKRKVGVGDQGGVLSSSIG